MFQLSAFFQRHCRIIRVVILAFLWTTSLIYGVYTASRDLSVVVLMHLLPSGKVSIVGLFVVLFLPLLISIASVYYRKTIVIYILSMLKGFSAGYCIWGIASVYGSAGWLIDALYFFSDSFITVILLCFWFRLIYAGTNLKRDCTLALLSTSFVGIIDYFLVAPFTVSLANQL